MAFRPADASVQSSASAAADTTVADAQNGKFLYLIHTGMLRSLSTSCNFIYFDVLGENKFIGNPLVMSSRAVMGLTHGQIMLESCCAIVPLDGHLA